ncbi:MAG: hypothetical protein KAW56_09840 [Candidatus Marinimicrobia bacterium]|nr:hypothetical protein [Candidatus Neomarinimicrobiota bacterium]
MMKTNKRSIKKKVHKKDLLSESGKILKGWFFTNTKIKVGIFIFALLIWFFTVLGKKYTYTFDVFLDVRNIVQGKTLKEKIPKRIRASFSGKGLDLFFLSMSAKSSFKFVLDLQSIRWFYDFQLNEYFSDNPEKIIIPRNADVEFSQIVWPDTVHVELDRFSEVKVPVISQLNIEVAPGYIVVDDPQLYPDSVIISGPRTYVRKYKKIITEEFSRTNLSTSLEVNLQLKASDSDNVTIFPSSIEVIQKVEQIGERTLDNIPIDIIGVPKDINVDLSPSSISLTVSSGVSLIKTLEPKDIKVFFDFSKSWKFGKSTYIPSVSLPKGVIEWSNMTPRKIEVRVVRERTH